MGDTALFYAPALWHDFPDHPEHAGRVPAIRTLLEQVGLWERLKMVEGMPATPEQLQRVHTPRLLQFIEGVALRGGGMVTADTYMTDRSYELAQLAAGGCCSIVDQLFEGDARNGLALVRPPGHHAEQDHVSGFCLINNVAVAARHAQDKHKLKRVMIIDVDVHHGNGTQDIFYNDPSVLFASLHMYSPYYFYPGTGSHKEVGSGGGAGYTINVPFASNVGDVGYFRTFQELIVPVAEQFQPQLLLVSTGFDAHWQDPLAEANLSLDGYYQICKLLIDLAEQLCEGKILFVLEGGYYLPALAHGVLNLTFLLNNMHNFSDPLGTSPNLERDVDRLIHSLRAIHLPS